MPEIVETSIVVGEKILTQFTSLKLSQGIYGHHSFQLQYISDESDTIYNLAGEPFRLQWKPVKGDKKIEFTGIVTGVEVMHQYGSKSRIVISGYSPTIRLDQYAHCKSWERNGIKNIVEDVLKPFAPDWIKYEIIPANNETLSYIVQYNETAWQFICRLAGMFGEWLYYDGKRLVLGPGGKSKISVEYGTRLSRFTMRAELKASNMNLLSYDYLHMGLYNSSVSKKMEGLSGLNDAGKYVMQKSHQLYGTVQKQWYDGEYRKKRQLDEYVSKRAVMLSSDVISYTGKSDMPGILPGVTIEVKAPGDGNKP